MLILLRKNWIHLLIWIGMAVYLIIAPKIYARFMIKEGKPIRFSEELPSTTDQILTSVDQLETVSIEGENLFTLSGWSFYFGQTDQPGYERYIVLKSKQHTYLFSTTSTEQPNLPIAFPEFHFRNAGFSTYIAQDSISPGRYQVGVLFKQLDGGELYFRPSNVVIICTPNTLVLDSAQESDVFTSDADSSTEIDLMHQIPVLTNQIKYSIDRLDPLESSEGDLYNLWGWAFYIDDNDQAKYERYIILQSEIEILTFPAETFERPDLPSAFPHLTMSLVDSGITTDLSASDIPEGTYHIGLLFVNRENNLKYFIETNKHIISSSDGLQLVIPYQQP